MNLKGCLWSCPYAISVEKLIFKIFLDVLQLRYNPSNFARAILPSAMGQRVNQNSCATDFYNRPPQPYIWRGSTDHSTCKHIMLLFVTVYICIFVMDIQIFVSNVHIFVMDVKQNFTDVHIFVMELYLCKSANVLPRALKMNTKTYKNKWGKLDGKDRIYRVKFLKNVE